MCAQSSAQQGVGAIVLEHGTGVKRTWEEDKQKGTTGKRSNKHADRHNHRYRRLVDRQTYIGRKAGRLKRKQAETLKHQRYIINKPSTKDSWMVLEIGGH